MSELSPIANLGAGHRLPEGARALRERIGAREPAVRMEWHDVKCCAEGCLGVL